MFGRNPYRSTLRLLHLSAVWLLILIIPSDGRAQLESTMPLAVGNSWSYTSGADDLTITVAGPATVLGRATYRLVFDRGQAETYDEFLSWNSQGQLLLHARQASGAEPTVFEPPLVWFSPGSRQGVGGTVDLYADIGGRTEPAESFYYVAYMGDEIVDTPAGRFEVTHVDELNTEAEARWYTAGIGLVQLIYPEGTGIYVLVSQNMAVAVEESTWSHVKALYR